MNKQELIKHFEEMEYVSISQMGKKSFIDLIEQLDEPKKVTVPQFVADWIEECKNDDFHLFGAMEGISLNQKNLIIGLEKMTTWNFLPVHGLTATRSRKRNGIM